MSLFIFFNFISLRKAQQDQTLAMEEKRQLVWKQLKAISIQTIHQYYRKLIFKPTVQAATQSHL